MCYFIVSVSIPDPAGRAPYDEYIARVRPIVESHGGRYLVRSEKVEHRMGAWQPERVIVIAFDDRPALEACFASPEYRAIKALRSETVTTSAVIVED